ncbi:hypothetical protein DMN91_011489 [Ooceraea biroi]|uniref:Uncharacterized protein n=1 Tax=Ooceraea biroi TaxID=2015173 RepID=A0A3L8D662_OOCBI|nr:hypothetical protein DMN91_011489 [Ooceraea biroi]
MYSSTFYTVSRCFTLPMATIGNDWCSVVPQSWVDINKKLCMWPSHGINVSKAIKKSLPPQASWESVSYKYILGPYDSFEQAKSKEKDAQFVSSDDAKINALQNKKDILPLKREKKRKQYDNFSETFSSDSDLASEKGFKNAPTILVKSSDDKQTLKRQKMVASPCNYKKYNNNLHVDVKQKARQLEEDQYSLPSRSIIDESQPLYYGDYFSQDEQSFLDNIPKYNERDIQKDKLLDRCSKKVKTSTNATFNMKEKKLPVVKYIDYNPDIPPELQIKKGVKHKFRKEQSDSVLQMQEKKYSAGKEITIENINERTTENINKRTTENISKRTENISEKENAKEDSILINRTWNMVLHRVLYVVHDTCGKVKSGHRICRRVSTPTNNAKPSKSVWNERAAAPLKSIRGACEIKPRLPLSLKELFRLAISDDQSEINPNL